MSFSANPLMKLTNGSVLSDDFREIIGSDGLLKICGVGSLLSKKSALYTFPNLKNFRCKKVKNFRRVFGHVAPIFFERKIANIETREISSCGAEPHKGIDLIVSIFDIPGDKASINAFIEREHEFKFRVAEIHDVETDEFDGFGIICSISTDEEYKATRCPPEEFKKRFEKFGIYQVFRNDILPCAVYLRHCLLAAKGLNKEAYDNFINTSFLADRKTKIAEYLEKNPRVLDALPPLEFVERYSG